MKMALKKALICVLLICASLCVLAGCSFRPSYEEYLEENNLKAQVTYYTNGGKFEDDRDYKDLYYKVGYPALNIGKADIESGTIKLTRADHEFLSWYYVSELDESGKPVKDENGDIILGEEVDFSVKLNEGDHWHICAVWATLSKVKVKLVCDETATVKIETNLSGVAEWKECKNGDIIRDYSFNQGYVQSTVEPSLAVENATHTFIKFYANAECSEEIAWPIAQPDKEAEEQDVYIYAQYIEGDWTVIRNVDDVKKFFKNTDKAENRFYLLNDIDCAGATITGMDSAFNGELQGNGYTVSNFVLEKSKIPSMSSLSLFGDIGENAIIKNVSFESYQANYSVMSEAYVSVYLAFSSIAETATVENVALDGVVNVTLGKNAELMNNISGNWKFGGFTNDSAYNGDITISTTSKINVK